MQRNNGKEPHQNQGLYIFECVMSLLYLGASYFFLFTKIFEGTISSKTIRLVLGVLLGTYGLYRVFRAVKKRNKRY